MVEQLSGSYKIYTTQQYSIHSTPLRIPLVFSGWNRPKDDTERLASCLKFCGFSRAFQGLSRAFQGLFPSGVDRGRASPKTQAKSTTQTTRLAGQRDVWDGRCLAGLGSLRNDWHTMQLMMMDVIVILMEASPVMVDSSIQDVWVVLAFVVTNFGREWISVGKLGRKFQVHTLVLNWSNWPLPDC